MSVASQDKTEVHRDLAYGLWTGYSAAIVLFPLRTPGP
jgi:hypothetical protein